ncbi:rod shape-determining protein MreC [bacterium]|jgi:rod shape-determining protein mreC|nr:rod shape-determining protein MreC [bacterium]
MIKKYKDYIILLGVFLLFLFASQVNRFLTAINPNLDTSKIVINYDKHLKEELDNIKKINDIKFDDNLDIIVSRVKYRDVYEYSNTLTIFKGTKNNVNVGDAVLTNNGLVGVISKTYDYYSVVSLITNKKSNISVKINDAVGVLKLENGKLVVTSINNYKNISIGDEIYTSGLGNLPDNIYVGKVKKVSLNDTEIEKVIEVDIENRLDTLDYLFIWRINHD